MLTETYKTPKAFEKHSGDEQIKDFMFLFCSFGKRYDVRVILIKFQTIQIFLIVNASSLHLSWGSVRCSPI